MTRLGALLALSLALLALLGACGRYGPPVRAAEIPAAGTALPAEAEPEHAQEPEPEEGAR